MSRAASACFTALVLAGCAGQRPGPSLPHYVCEHGVEFTVRFVDDTALLDAGPRGYDVLYRDAASAMPLQNVYSSPRARAEFGLGASGREAVLRYPLLPLAVRCLRD